MPAKATSARILVVDDEELIPATLAEYLTQEGFTVATSPDGERALLAAADQCFDIALCDMHLPGIDGIELLDRLLKISRETFVLTSLVFGQKQRAGVEEVISSPSKGRRFASVRTA